jgi:hypothetical protein
LIEFFTGYVNYLPRYTQHSWIGLKAQIHHVQQIGLSLQFRMTQLGHDILGGGNSYLSTFMILSDFSKV